MEILEFQKQKFQCILLALAVQALHPAFEVVLKEHTQPVDVLNAQPILVPKQQGLAVDALVLYQVQAQSFVQTAASSLVQGNPVEQLHQVLSRSSQSIQEALRTALATSSEVTTSLNDLYQQH